MSFLANIIFCRKALIKTESIPRFIPFVVNVSWLRFSSTFEYSFEIDEAFHKNQEFDAHFETNNSNLPLNPIHGKLCMARIAHNGAQRTVTNTFHLTQTSKRAAIFEFTSTDDGVLADPPLLLNAVKYQHEAHKPIWLITGKKETVMRTLFPNGEENCFGFPGWLSDHVDVIIAPSHTNDKFYTLQFVLKFAHFECARSEALTPECMRKIATKETISDAFLPIQFPPDFLTSFQKGDKDIDQKSEHAAALVPSTQCKK